MSIEIYQPDTLSKDRCMELFQASRPYRPLAVRAEYLLVIKGFEHMQHLAFSFPLPSLPTSLGGVVRFYETRNFDTALFLSAVGDIQLQAEIHHATYGLIFTLDDVEIRHGAQPPADWSVKPENALLIVDATITWASAEFHPAQTASVAAVIGGGEMPKPQFAERQSVWLKSGSPALYVLESLYERATDSVIVHVTWIDADGVVQDKAFDERMLVGVDPALSAGAAE